MYAPRAPVGPQARRARSVRDAQPHLTEDEGYDEEEDEEDEAAAGPEAQEPLLGRLYAYMLGHGAPLATLTMKPYPQVDRTLTPHFVLDFTHIIIIGTCGR